MIKGVEFKTMDVQFAGVHNYLKYLHVSVISRLQGSCCYYLLSSFPSSTNRKTRKEAKAKLRKEKYSTKIETKFRIVHSIKASISREPGTIPIISFAMYNID